MLPRAPALPPLPSPRRGARPRPRAPGPASAAGAVAASPRPCLSSPRKETLPISTSKGLRRQQQQSPGCHSTCSFSPEAFASPLPASLILLSLLAPRLDLLLLLVRRPFAAI